MAAKKNKPITQTDFLAFGERLINQMKVLVKGKVKNVMKSEIATIVRTEVRREVTIAKKETIKTVVSEMEALLENRGSDWLGVTGEEVKLMKDKQGEHEERITTVEQKIGLRA